ncbi:hypothetical protein FRC0191_01873 [Corynebacterium diphtheriae]|nr:hypothetical protein FRC0191_01873 [Corynebacterium diphtheriae]
MPVKPFITNGGTNTLTPPSLGERRRKHRRRVQRELEKQIHTQLKKETPTHDRA